MLESPEKTLLQIHKNQFEYFQTHVTKSIDFRLIQLKKLKSVIEGNQEEIQQALWKDLHKSAEEAYLTEIGLVLSEIRLHIRNVSTWAKPHKVHTPLPLFPAKSWTITEPLGVSLIIAPWNYPFLLLMNPLIGAISSGCCTMLKPSPDAPETAKVMEKMIKETYESNYISIVQGGRETNEILLQQKFDLIFFTGSSTVGKVVMKAAAENLTPVVLELGGKSPCIVDKEANLDLSAKRIIWGKLLNAGQTCIAPDYVFAHSQIKDKLLQKMVEQIHEMFGEDGQKNRFYGRIVHENAFDRLLELLKKGELVTGGNFDKSDLYISPTILDKISIEDSIMQEEIFGPILPILTFDDISEPINYINSKEKPLAFYYFGKNRKASDVLRKTSSGGVCINDTVMQIANHNLPFGGVGNSGMGKYHGHESFLAFSNRRSVIRASTWLDLPFKYVPFKWFGLAKRLVR
jgi:aldehyde dehydrogenase (NAD+)